MNGGRDCDMADHIDPYAVHSVFKDIDYSAGDSLAC